MAHCTCFNGHDMWNGCGEPDVYVYSLQLYKEFDALHPDFIVGEDDYYTDIYDIIFMPEFEGRMEIDCWLCPDCGSVAVFDSYPSVHKKFATFRFDYIQDSDCDITSFHYHAWDQYFAVRTKELGIFDKFVEGKKPYEALITCPVGDIAYVSSDHKHIFVINLSTKQITPYKMVREIHFEHS